MSIESYRAPGGATLYYRYDDFTDPWKDSPTVIMAHGFGGRSSKWYKWVPPLSPHFRVVRVDLRGLGLSKLPIEMYRNSYVKGVYTSSRVESLALDAIALMDHLKVEKVVWIGEHTGALTGVMLSILVPERLHALCVMGAPLKPMDIPAFQAAEIAPNPEALGFRESTDYMRSRGMRAWGLATEQARRQENGFSPEYNKWQQDEMAQEDPLNVAEFRRGMLEVNMIPIMKDIAVPTLWVDADRNPVLTPTWRQVIESQPKIRLVHVPWSGYGVGYGNSEACIAEVKSFLLGLGVWPA